MVSRSLRDPRAPKASFSDLRAFAGLCGRLRAFCGRFAGNSGWGRRENVPILKSHKNIGALVVLGDFTKKTSRFTKSKSKPRTTRKFMENESPGGSVARKCRSEVWIRSVIKKSCSAARCSEALLRSVAQKCVSLRYVCRNVARIVAQERLPLSSVAAVCACGNLAQTCRSKVLSEVSLTSAAQCCPDVFFRGVSQKCGSTAGVAYMCVCAFAQKCCSEVLIRSIDQKCCSELSLRSVIQQCCSELSLRSVDEERGSEVLIRSVAQNCRSEVWIRSVDPKCGSSEVLVRIAQKCYSEVSIRSV